MNEFKNPTEINSESMSNSTASYKAAFGEDNSYQIIPVFRQLLLEITKKSKGGIILQESRNKDTDEIRKVVKAGIGCLEVKDGDYVLIAMHNRPDFAYGPNGEEYFIMSEVNVKAIYRKEEIEKPQLDLFTSTITK